ncbi:MAG TPA: hypothetical protein VG674_04340 [Amycolatopsis sp.]|nr:hypothetical protein [Amycolatopsis sp.]
MHFGQPTDTHVRDPNSTDNASACYSAKTGQVRMARQTWRQRGWEQGALGFPTTDEQPTADGWIQRFQHGTIFWNRRTNTPAVTLA